LNDSLQLLKASPDAYQAIADIYNVYVRDGGQTMEERIHTAEDIAAWVAKFHDREGLFVLTSANKLLGWGIIKRYSDREGYRLACETAVYLWPEERGKGYGKFIKKELIKICREWNYHHLVAKIFASNEGSIVYNQKLGYEIVGRQREIGFKKGQWVDIVIMQLILD
jgi:L-amino acid N-acyltransferase YncA